MFKNRIRLPITFSKPQFPVERSQFRLANGATKVLSAIVRNTYEGKTDHLPEDWHRKLVIALNHDEVTVEDNRLLTDVALDGDYGIDWQDFLNNPVAQSTFTVEVTPFNATNSNCQSCQEITQIELVDDTTDDIFDQGDNYDYPVSVLTNDKICCFPFVVELLSFNTLYIDSATIDQDGIFNFTLKTPLLNINNVLLGTYRVTCDNGSYDDADIFGNISGTSTECAPPGSIDPPVFNTGDDTIATIEWAPASPAPALGYNWFLYLEPDIYTAVQAGDTALTTLNLTGLVAGESYLFAVQSNCGDGDVSTFVTYEFIQPFESPDTCGTFTVSHFPPSYEDTTFTYMDCFGDIVTRSVVLTGNQDVCMMKDILNNPVFFTTPSIYITYVYTVPC